ncbi:hypothetical protein D3C73_1233330 [compost metagenome]
MPQIYGHFPHCLGQLAQLVPPHNLRTGATAQIALGNSPGQLQGVTQWADDQVADGQGSEQRQTDDDQRRDALYGHE